MAPRVWDAPWGGVFHGSRDPEIKDFLQSGSALCLVFFHFLHSKMRILGHSPAFLMKIQQMKNFK